MGYLLQIDKNKLKLKIKCQFTKNFFDQQIIIYRDRLPYEIPTDKEGQYRVGKGDYCGIFDPGSKYSEK